MVKLGKDFASFCRIMKLYFPDFIEWLAGLKDPRKFWAYETEAMPDDSDHEKCLLYQQYAANDRRIYKR